MSDTLRTKERLNAANHRQQRMIVRALYQRAEASHDYSIINRANCILRDQTRDRHMGQDFQKVLEFNTLMNKRHDVPVVKPGLLFYVPKEFEAAARKLVWGEEDDD